MKLYYLFLLFCVLSFSCKDDLADNKIDGKTAPHPTVFAAGITKISDDSLAFKLFAPGKQTVHLIGDFNNWAVSDTYKMQKDSNDYFFIKIGNLEKGKEYVCQYLIDNSIRIADPYTDKIADPWNDKDISSTIYPGLIPYPIGKTSEIAMVVTTEKTSYPWKVDNFRITNHDDLVIYELLIRDFTEQGSIKAAKEKISYLKNLGVNAVQLMPFNEFEANNSWGYNPSFFFAADKAYGTRDDYKAFIDECHSQGMAVIMDIVLNHTFGQSPLLRMYQKADKTPTADNPWYNEKSNFSNPDAQWGYDLNHESVHTKALVDSVCSYWMKEYKIDGFRFDFTKGFSNTPYPATGNDAWGNPYDAARINNLKRIYDEIKKRKPDALMICEHLSDNSEETELANYGIYLWGNINYNVNESTMGWGEEEGGYGPKGDFGWAVYSNRGWTSPNLVAYMESHDEERLMFKNLSWGKVDAAYNVKDLDTALQRNAAAAVVFMSIPGPKMIWQFGELGYDYELNNDRLGKKPVRWDYYNEASRKKLYDVYATMNKLRNQNPAFSTKDYVMKIDTNYKKILLKSTDKYVVAIANMGTQTKSEEVEFVKTGSWVEYFTNATLNVTQAKQSVELKAGEYKLYISN